MPAKKSLLRFHSDGSPSTLAEPNEGTGGAAETNVEDAAKSIISKADKPTTDLFDTFKFNSTFSFQDST
jgi:hypothetical protein